MSRKLSIGLVASLLLLAWTFPEIRADWPGFRGPRAHGVDDSRPLPARWNLETGENLLFRVPVPGLGHSSPVIRGDRVFVTTARNPSGEQSLRVGLYGDIIPVTGEEEIRWEIHCLDRRTGEKLWDRVAHEGKPRVMRHTKASHANSTPAVDGERVVAFFGSEGLHAWSHEGEKLWTRDLGHLDSGYFRVPAAQWGFASSPVLHEDRVIVQCDVQKGSFLAVLDAKTGDTIWKKPRVEVPTWSTPTIHTGDAGTQIIVNGYQHAGSYAFSDGEELWRITDGGDIPVPTPIVTGDLAFLTSAHGSLSPIYAVRLSARGDITPEKQASKEEKQEEVPSSESGLAWHRSRGGNYMQTPIAYRDLVYFCRDNGVLSCFDSTSGERHFITRLGGRPRTGFTSSPVAGDGKLYYTSEEGEVFVLKAGPSYELLERNQLDEVHMSSPAIDRGVIYFRTRGHLVAVHRADSPEESGESPKTGPEKDS